MIIQILILNGRKLLSIYCGFLKLNEKELE